MFDYPTSSKTLKPESEKAPNRFSVRLAHSRPSRARGSKGPDLLADIVGLAVIGLLAYLLLIGRTLV